MSDVVVVGDEEIRRWLARFEVGPLNKALQKGTDAGAKLLKPRAQAASPRRTGKLRKSISATRARRQRPASIVRARVWYRHFVMLGTKPHRIRFPDQKAAGVPRSEGNIEHPGAKANPFMSRTADRYDDQALNTAMEVTAKELDL